MAWTSPARERIKPTQKWSRTLCVQMIIWQDSIKPPPPTAVSYILASCYLHSGWLTFIPESLYVQGCAAPIVPLLSLFVDWWLRTIDPPLAQDQDDGVCADALPLTDPKNMLFFSPLNLVFQPTPSFLQTFPSVFFTRRELLMNLNPIHCVLSTSFLPHY